jgi:hypothetical protein
LRAAIAGVENALETSSVENRNGLIRATIPMLQDTVYKMIGQLRREITAIPLPGTNWNPLKNQSEDVRTKLNKCAVTFAFCLQGISVLSQAYFTLDERETGDNSALRLIGELQDAGIGSAEHKARHLSPRDTEDRPERPWAEFHRFLPELIELFQLENRSRVDAEELNVELLPEQVAAILNAPD